MIEQFIRFAVTPAPTDALKKLFGGGVSGAPLGGGDVTSTFSNLFVFSVNMILVVAAIFALVYLLWGAFDYVISSGEEALITKARKKMMSAVIGIFLIIAALTLWIVITRGVLGIVGGSGGGFEIKLPTLRSIVTPSPGATPCLPGNCHLGTSCPAGKTLDPAFSCSFGSVCCK